MRRRRIHVHIGRLVVEGGLDRLAFERALAEAVSPAIEVGHVASVPVLRIETGPSTRNPWGAIGSAIGRGLHGSASAAASSRSGHGRR